MPIYDFQCAGCGRKFERIVHHDIESVTCECGTSATRDEIPQIRHRGAAGTNANNSSVAFRFNWPGY